MKKLILAAAAFAAITTGANALNAQGGWLNGEDELGRRDRLVMEVATCKGGHPRMEAIKDIIQDERDALEYPRDVRSIQWRESLVTFIENRLGTCEATVDGLIAFIHEHNYTHTLRNSPQYINVVASWYFETVTGILTLTEMQEALNRL